LYQRLGAPGYDDLALSARIQAAQIAHDSRPDQASYEAGLPPSPELGTPAPDYARLMDKLRDEVTKRPDDLQGHILLARNEAALGNFIAARQAQAKVIALKGDKATAQDYLDHAQFMIEAAG